MKSLPSVRGALVTAACVGCLVAAVWAQKPLEKNDSDNPPAGSLGDLARQTRAHAAADEGKSSHAQELVDEMQQEQEVADNAPVGFKNYDAGDYRLFVPYPFSLEGRENGGTVLLGSRLGITNTEVMAGTPIQVPPNLSDADLLNAVRQLASLHGTQAYCSATTRGSHKAFRCSWQTSPYLLGHVVFGSMEFILASNRLIPVMCVSPDDLHQNCVIYDTYGHNTCSDRERQLYGWDHRKAQAAADAQYRDERTTVQMCDQVIYPSIQLKEDIVVHPVSIAEGKAPKPVSAVAQDMSVVAGAQALGGQGASLADLARQSRQAAHGKALATLDNAEGKSLAPAGYQSFPMQYCQNPQQCQQASVIIPEKSEVVSTTNGQYIFKAMLNGDAVMLYAGPADVNSPYRSMTSPDYMRMRDLANSNGWSREKADGVSTQELTIEGRSALMTRFRYQRDQKNWWIGERALIEMRGGGQFLVGCSALEEHFADAESLCTTLVNSLRLP
jgi:hypothetical protein